MNREKLMLIDGHSLINRAFYGMPDLMNSKGVHTGAVYGFLNILFRMLEEEKPDYLLVAFDTHAPTFRHGIYADYKGTRKGMPEELRPQVPLLRQVLEAMQVACFNQAGWEADDILGSCARQAEADGLEVKIVSGDRDLLQIVTENITVRLPRTSKGQTTVEDYTPDSVYEHFGVRPDQIVDLKALMGDSSDNIPGVPKVGEKTGVQLLKDYETLEGVYAHLEEISRKALKETLSQNRDLADLSRTLATIKTDCELPFERSSLKLSELYTEAVYPLFVELGFKQFLGRFDAGAVTEKKEGSAARPVTVVTAEPAAEDAFAVLRGSLREGRDARRLFVLPVYGDETPKEHVSAKPEELRALMISSPEKSFLFRVADDAEGALGISEDYLVRKMTRLRGVVKDCAEAGEGTEPALLGIFDLKRNFPLLGLLAPSQAEDADLKGLFDLMLAAYLLYPLKSDYSLEDVAVEYGGGISASAKTLFGKKTPAEALAEEPEKYASYLAELSAGALCAMPALEEKLKDQGMLSLYRDVERPLSLVLYDMQRLGVKIRPEALTEYSAELGREADRLMKAIYEEAGEEFNISSPKQLGEILFEKLGLPEGKKTKTGYSTAADVLEKLAPFSPIVRNVLDYRAVTKLKSTYADGLMAYVGEGDRIHTRFQQTITATGRISSADPNLQNIPMRTEMGRRIRKAFIPREGASFTDADYSQIELRILAAMSGDPQLIEAYRENKDIHRSTASKVFHVPFEEVTDEQRRGAKAVNFGIVYGISAFGLSQDLGISRAQASEYIDSYFATYPQVKTYLDACVETATKERRVATLYGRIRPIPELESSNFMTRQFGERVAMNSPIQGTAADIMKIAMIAVWKRLARENCASRMILQIHDELLIETAPGEEETVARILREEMEGAAQLEVPLVADVHSGRDWYEAK